MPDREHGRQVAGRPGVEQRRNERPDSGLGASAAIATVSAGRARSSSTRMET